MDEYLDREFELASEFFHCAEIDLHLDKFIRGTVYADGGYDYEAVFSVPHTRTECIVRFSYANDEHTVSEVN